MFFRLVLKPLPVLHAQQVEAQGKMPAMGSDKHNTMMRRLRTEAERAKKELSEEEEYIIDLPALAKGMDQNLTLTRRYFEELCADLFEQCTKKLNELFKKTQPDSTETVYKKVCHAAITGAYLAQPGHACPLIA